MAQQRRIVAELDALQSQLDTLKTLQTDTAAELDALLLRSSTRLSEGNCNEQPQRQSAAIYRGQSAKR